MELSAAGSGVSSPLAKKPNTLAEEVVVCWVRGVGRV